MLGLSKKEKKFFVNFLIGHIALICIAGFLGLLPSCEEQEKKVHVFELASASFLPHQVNSKSIPPSLPVTRVSEPRIKPIIKSKPKKVVVNKPTPKPQTVPLPKQKPSIKPKPKPVTSPKTVSFDQFKKKHNLPTPKTHSKNNKIRPKVQINPNNFSLPQITVVNNRSQKISVDPSILNQYLNEVKGKLEAAWNRLEKSSNVSSGGEVYLSFKISSNGTLVSPSISKTSGNVVLDRLVMQVSKTVGNLGRPPGGELSSLLEIPFRVR